MLNLISGCLIILHSNPRTNLILLSMKVLMTRFSQLIKMAVIYRIVILWISLNNLPYFLFSLWFDFFTDRRWGITSSWTYVTHFSNSYFHFKHNPHFSQNNYSSLANLLNNWIRKKKITWYLLIPWFWFLINFCWCIWCFNQNAEGHVHIDAQQLHTRTHA